MFKQVIMFALAAFAAAEQVVDDVEYAVLETDAPEATSNSLSGTASWTWYESYPKCCKDCGNYDANWPKDECSDYDGCKYCGDFEDGTHETLSWVKANNIISFFDKANPSASYWKNNYKDKTVTLTANGKTFNAIIKDTCADTDCGGCCTKNAKTGYLIDMEYYTVLRNFGTTDAADGTISFKIL